MMNKSMFAVWLWPDTVARLSPRLTAQWLADAGVTDIYLLVKGQSGAVCFDGSKTALKTALPGLDILPEMLKSAHEYGMRVHAWLTSSHDAAFHALYPESGLCHFKRGRDRDIVTITNERYREYMAAVVREMFEKCAPDGLHLDYIRYNHLTYGWAKEDREALKKRGVNLEYADQLIEKTFFGDAPDGRSVFDAYERGDGDMRQIAQFRRENVTAFAQAMTQAARQTKKDTVLSAALMPEGAYAGNDRAGDVSGVAFAALHYGQSYADAAKLYDHAAIMAYAPTYGKDGSWIRHLVQNAANIYGCRTAAGLQAYGVGNSATLQENMRALTPLNSEPKFLGCALFRAGETILCRAEKSNDGMLLTVNNLCGQPLTKLTVSQSDVQTAQTEAPAQEFALQNDSLLKPGGTLLVRLPFALSSASSVRVFFGAEEGRAYVYDEQRPIL